jgi:hypothetical protein
MDLAAELRWVRMLHQLAAMQLEVARRRQHGPGTGINR